MVDSVWRTLDLSNQSTMIWILIFHLEWSAFSKSGMPDCFIQRSLSTYVLLEYACVLDPSKSISVSKKGIALSLSICMHWSCFVLWNWSFSFCVFLLFFLTSPRLEEFWYSALYVFSLWLNSTISILILYYNQSCSCIRLLIHVGCATSAKHE